MWHGSAPVLVKTTATPMWPVAPPCCPGAVRRSLIEQVIVAEIVVVDVVVDVVFGGDVVGGSSVVWTRGVVVEEIAPDGLALDGWLPWHAAATMASAHRAATRHFI
jgi:hypothetical protein